MSNLIATLAISAVAALGLALLSAVAGFGGGGVAASQFTGLIGLRVTVGMLKLTQIASIGGGSAARPRPTTDDGLSRAARRVGSAACVERHLVRLTNPARL